MAGTVLLTGFEPFGGESSNPSWTVAQALHGSRLSQGAQVQALQLPCVFSQAWPVLQAAIAAQAPQLVLALGLAGTRSELCVERVALNWVDARIPDNAGAQPLDQAIVADAPLAWRTRLPVKAMVQAMREAGAPASVSYTAGTFVCNQLLFWITHTLEAAQLAGQPLPWQGGFVHVPPLAPAPGGVALDQQVAAVRAALEVAWDGAPDLAQAGGTLD
ncbi:pyroglutamyl-peptidase I [Curvibacter sp. RS43]|uniref:Pyrrolidone-carboxylate peptidase n=1 Tax=Curvibacter microcysteis TaxID=3026419 RepID=A0ABT5MFN9_9BURK|nr:MULTISPECIES: pyroglutamyl-peptidase I [unclassified Curvibacter]MDD0808808.1 pyroglutamyl-peptidase I [Curvibacter sp. RS43]MDD0815368.1 pyroglutamyl-peptidase I [Curvibacter sp. HBC28]